MQISKKIALLGKFGVGKSSLVKRYVYQKFDESYLTTIGVKVDKKVVDIDGVHLNMLIWDIAGETDMSKIPLQYKMGSHGVLLVFDVTRPSSYSEIEEDIRSLRESLPDAAIQVIGNKVDLLSETQLDEFKNKMTLENVIYTSAKTGESVDNAFTRLGERILR